MSGRFAIGTPGDARTPGGGFRLARTLRLDEVNGRIRPRTTLTRPQRGAGRVHHRRWCRCSPPRRARTHPGRRHPLAAAQANARRWSVMTPSLPQRGGSTAAAEEIHATPDTWLPGFAGDKITTDASRPTHALTRILTLNPTLISSPFPPRPAAQRSSVRQTELGRNLGSQPVGKPGEATAVQEQSRQERSRQSKQAAAIGSRLGWHLHWLSRQGGVVSCDTPGLTRRAVYQECHIDLLCLLA